MNSTDASADDTLDLHLPEEFVALFRSPAHDAAEAGTARAREDLLDGIADWGPRTPPPGSSTWSPPTSNGTCRSSPAG